MSIGEPVAVSTSLTMMLMAAPVVKLRNSSKYRYISRYGAEPEGGWAGPGSTGMSVWGSGDRDGLSWGVLLFWFFWAHGGLPLGYPLGPESGVQVFRMRMQLPAQLSVKVRAGPSLPAPGPYPVAAG